MYDDETPQEYQEAPSAAQPAPTPMEEAAQPTPPAPPPKPDKPLPPEAAPVSVPPKFVRQMSKEDVDTVNSVIRQAEAITNVMHQQWEVRSRLRQVIADMTCPWKVCDIIQIGDGRGPLDRRVITAVLGGVTEEQQFYRVKTRVLKHGAHPGKKEINLKLSPEFDITIVGKFEGVLPERVEKEEAREV